MDDDRIRLGWDHSVDFVRKVVFWRKMRFERRPLDYQ